MNEKNPVYPGAIIREDFVKELGISVSDTSRKLGGVSSCPFAGSGWESGVNPQSGFAAGACGNR